MLGKQPQVERVEHGTHARDGVVQLEVSVVVEGEGGDPVARFDAEPLQGPGEPIDPLDQLGVGHAMQALLAARHDLALSMQLLEAPEHVLHAELVVLHQAFHSRHLHKLVVGSTL